jgi:hypothetical protein
VTRDEIVSAVLDRLSIEAGDSVKVTQVQTYLQMEHQRIVVEERLIRKVANVALTANSDSAPLPADFGAVASLRAGDEPLEPVSDRRQMELDATTVGATVATDWTPTHYSFVSADPPTLWVWPTPGTSSATGLRLWYWGVPTLITTNVAPPGLPSFFHDMLVEALVFRIALAEEEPGLAAAAKQMYDELRGRLHQYRIRRSGPGAARGYLTVYGD